MKRSLLLAASLCVAAPLYAEIEQQEGARLESLSREEMCQHMFQEVLVAFDGVEPTSKRYADLLVVGIGLINLACKGETGLTSTEQLLMYKQLVDKVDAALTSVEQGTKPYLNLLARKSVIVKARRKIVGQIKKSKTA